MRSARPTIPAAIALALALAPGGPAGASERRELGAHVHGQGTLTIAVEGGTVEMELEAPGADIAGFEHAARTPEDRARIDAAVAALARPLELFVLPEAAGCRVAAAEVTLLEEEHGGEAHEGGAHGEAHHADEARTAAEGDHDHAAETAEAGHAEFRAAWRLTCADAAAITRIDFAYFAAFPAAEALRVEIVSERGARAFTVERAAPRLDLAGSI